MSESLNQHEPAPQPSDHPAAWDLVLADIHERDAMGEAKYKVRLTPFNGRNFVKDAYQEALDLTVYLRGAVYEIETLKTKVAELERQLAEAQESEGKAWNSRDELLKDRNALLDQTRIGPLRAEEWQIRAIRAERQLAEAKEDTAIQRAIVGLEAIESNEHGMTWAGATATRTLREVKAIRAARKERG